MSDQLNLKPYQFQKREGMYVLTRVDNYLRLANNSAQEVYLQGGKFFAAGGPEIQHKDVPQWVFEAMKDCSDAALTEVGFTKPASKPETKAEQKPSS